MYLKEFHICQCLIHGAQLCLANLSRPPVMCYPCYESVSERGHLTYWVYGQCRLRNVFSRQQIIWQIESYQAKLEYYQRLINYISQIRVISRQLNLKLTDLTLLTFSCNAFPYLNQSIAQTQF